VTERNVEVMSDNFQVQGIDISEYRTGSTAPVSHSAYVGAINQPSFIHSAAVRHLQ